MKKDLQNKLLRLNYDLYEKQAESWDKTRSAIWEKPTLDFIKTIKPNSKILDLGCGNGRLYKQISKLIANSQKPIANYLGLDPSKELIKICKTKYIDPSTSLRMTPKFIVGDGLDMNFNRQFDYIFCLGVLHHIPGEELQIKFLKNCYKALKKSGILFLHVWNRHQNKYDDKKYVRIAGLEKNDLVIPWKNDKNYVRYVYRFNAAELKNLAKKAGFKTVNTFYGDKNGPSTKLRGLNIYLIAKKYE